VVLFLLPKNKMSAYDSEQYFLSEVDVYLLVQMTKLLLICSEPIEDKSHKHLL